jgi:hypothetical protein
MEKGDREIKVQKEQKEGKDVVEGWIYEINFSPLHFNGQHN